MNSKLRNTLSAIAASGATLAIALMVAVPAVNTPVQDVVAQDLPPAVAQRVDSVAPLAAAVALSAATAIAAEAHRDTDAHPLKSRKGKQHRRQTIVMPYFSFSPRG